MAGSKLTFPQKLRIDLAFETGRMDRVAALLDRFAAKGVDVAGVPFRLLDRAFAGEPAVVSDMGGLGRFTLGGQPRLFAAIVADYQDRQTPALRALVGDPSAHPRTRFEAMGWSVFLTNRAAPPTSGPATGPLFQFWDRDPPAEIITARREFASSVPGSLWFDADQARDYVAQNFDGEMVTLWDGLWHPALQSDVFRLLRLVHDGGLYIDADSAPGPKLPTFCAVAGGAVWGCAMTNVPGCAALNHFLAAPPNAPVLTEYLGLVVQNLRDRPFDNIFWLTGPGAFTRFLYRRGGGISLLPREVVWGDYAAQIDAGYKRSDRNWRVREHGLGLTDQGPLAAALSDLS